MKQTTLSLRYWPVLIMLLFSYTVAPLLGLTLRECGLIYMASMVPYVAYEWRILHREVADEEKRRRDKPNHESL